VDRNRQRFTPIRLTALTTSDAQIVASYHASGNPQVLGELLRRHIGNVRSLAYQMTFDDAAADDITQEAFLKVMSGLKSFRNESKFSTWLYRITMNTAHVHLRKQKQLVRNNVNAFAEVAERSATAEQRAINGEIMAQLDNALRGLSPKLRAAIVLTAIQQLSPSEAAAIENCSTATMYWRIHQARKLLKKELKGVSCDEER
jgi:RNA polymerase sigma-70 factor (ECF subfamily)